MPEGGIILISSGAYVDTELAAEFGRLPPAFLPIGHARLYALQLEGLSEIPGRRVLSIPETFEIPPWDLRALTDLGVQIVPVPDDLRLGESLLYVLNILGPANGPVRILHGDTLIYDLPADRLDTVGTGHAGAAYAWGVFDAADDSFRSMNEASATAEVLAGFFSFGDDADLRKALAQARGDFIAALNGYHHKKRLGRITVPDWLDFGHLQTFYLARCNIRTQRAFNTLRISYQTVEKSSPKREKMVAEASWFEELPFELRSFTPPYLGRREQGGDPGYAVEYLPLPSLHELFVFGQLGASAWSRIMESCFGFMQACVSTAVPDDMPSAISALTTDKTAARLAQFERESGVSLNQAWRYEGAAMPSLAEIAEITAAAISVDDRSALGVMHGDFCFTNIFFDFRRQQIRTIDPRGMVEDGTSTVYGDVRYDLAKLNHSISGCYDLILANRYACTGFADRNVSLSFPPDGAAGILPAIAAEYRVAGRGTADMETAAVTVHQFLSMLPLHCDRPDRQHAFVANALRLFAQHWGARL